MEKYFQKGHFHYRSAESVDNKTAYQHMSTKIIVAGIFYMAGPFFT
jgi:hypothetical protein